MCNALKLLDKIEAQVQLHQLELGCTRLKGQHGLIVYKKINHHTSPTQKDTLKRVEHSFKHILNYVDSVKNEFNFEYFKDSDSLRIIISSDVDQIRDLIEDQQFKSMPYED